MQNRLIVYLFGMMSGIALSAAVAGYTYHNLVFSLGGGIGGSEMLVAFNSGDPEYAMQQERSQPEFWLRVEEELQQEAKAFCVENGLNVNPRVHISGTHSGYSLLVDLSGSVSVAELVRLQKLKPHLRKSVDEWFWEPYRGDATGGRQDADRADLD